jgi:probable addiction module antidote protein
VVSGWVASERQWFVSEMSKTKTKPFDPAEYLDDSDAIAAYMSEAQESGSPAFVADALGVVARARGMQPPDARAKG